MGAGGRFHAAIDLTAGGRVRPDHHRWPGHSTARREVVPSGRLSACEGMHVGGGEGVAADTPVAAFHVLDHAPGDVAHVLALDRDHRVSQLADHLALLFLAEHVLDDPNLNERHWLYP